MGISLLDRAIATVAPSYALHRHRARLMLDAARAYEGASRGDGWRVRRAGASANTDHMADARELRNRARSLVQNVPYCARSLQVLVSATIGTGITPKAEGPDAARLDKLWSRWADVADADGKSDIYGLMATAYRAMEQDGEVLIRRRTRRMSDGLAVPLQLQVLEIDWLDGNKNGSLRGGGQIINGIEYDVLGRVKAYWLFAAHPGEAVRGSVRMTSAAVPAADIIHLFNPVRPGQGRGISRFAPVIARVRDLMLYEDAELARKNLEARLGVIVSGDPEAMSNSDDDGPSQLSGDGESMTDLGPLPSGGITHVSGATGFQTIEPKPAGGYVEYCKYNAHIITAGIGVPYESATGDMREVNFSSARIRQMEFRRDTEQVQWLVLIPQMCKPIWRWFDEAAALGGEVRNPGSSADWSTPRWDYVNPKQDIDSEIAGMGAGLLSPSESLRRRGYDADAVFVEMGKDYARMEQTRQAIINDDLGAFIGLATAFGRAAKRTIEADAYAFLASNPKLQSGKALFHADHGNLLAAALPGVESVDALRVKLAGQKDVGGNEVLDLAPALWLGPTKYGSAARVTNKAEYDPDAEGKLQRPNAVQGLFRDIVDTARIKDDKWYLFADPAECPVIEVAFLDGVTEPFLDYEEGFTVDGVRWKARLDFGLAALDYRGAQRCG